jgi:hypothetical protein
MVRQEVEYNGMEAKMETSVFGRGGHFSHLFPGVIVTLMCLCGCAVDDTAPTSIPPVPASPNLATEWTGVGTADLSSVQAGSLCFDQDISIIVKSGMNFSGIVRYTGKSTDTRVVDVSFFGMITNSGEIAIAESLYCCVNWSANPGGWAPATELACRLSAKGDTIYGTGTAHMGCTPCACGDFSWPYTFVWVKK